MRILFIGGTGRISKDVARYAVELGNEVYLLTRGSRERKMFVADGCHMLYGNIREPKSCRQFFEKSKQFYDVIIDFLEFEPDDLKQTLGLIDGCYKQFVFISSATVYKESEQVINEDSKEGNDAWSYSYNKYLCEQYLVEYFSNRTDSYYTIIQPYVTYGNTRVPYPLVPRNKKYEWSLVERIKNGQGIPTYEDGKTITALLNAKDFAKLVVGILGKEVSYNNHFIIADEEEVTWGEALKTIEKWCGGSLECIDLKMDTIIDYLPQYESVLRGDKGRNVRFSISKIKSCVPQYSKEVKLDDGIKEVIEFYESNPDKKKIDYYWNGQIDRLLRSQGYSDGYKYEFRSKKDMIAYYSGRMEILYYPYLILDRLIEVKNPVLRFFRNYARKVVLKIR